MWAAKCFTCSAKAVESFNKHAAVSTQLSLPAAVNIHMHLQNYIKIRRLKFLNILFYFLFYF